MQPFQPYPQQQIMQQPLLKTHCTRGTLIITDTHIIIELLGAYRSTTMSRSSFTALDTRMVFPSLFGLGGGCNLTFHGMGGERMRAKLVNPRKAKKIRAILTGR